MESEAESGSPDDPGPLVIPIANEAADPAAMLDVVIEQLAKLVDHPVVERAWYRFTDGVVVPGDAEDVAKVAFKAGYATALDQVGRVLGATTEQIRGQ